MSDSSCNGISSSDMRMNSVLWIRLANIMPIENSVENLTIRYINLYFSLSLSLSPPSPFQSLEFPNNPLICLCNCHSFFLSLMLKTVGYHSEHVLICFSLWVIEFFLYGLKNNTRFVSHVSSVFCFSECSVRITKWQIETGLKVNMLPSFNFGCCQYDKCWRMQSPCNAI
jgi:hypothetical protein